VRPCRTSVRPSPGCCCNAEQSHPEQHVERSGAAGNTRFARVQAKNRAAASLPARSQVPAGWPPDPRPAARRSEVSTSQGVNEARSTHSIRARRYGVFDPRSPTAGAGNEAPPFASQTEARPDPRRRPVRSAAARHWRALEASLASADESSVFEYALRLQYPNGRTFDYHRESERPLGVGNEFDAFGRTWRIACDVPPSRFSSEYPSKLEAFLCHPVGASGLVRTTQGH
jgi:hypothetical protein